MREESELIDKFFMSDWHRTLGTIMNKEVDRVWDECVASMASTPRRLA